MRWYTRLKVEKKEWKKNWTSNRMVNADLEKIERVFGEIKDQLKDKDMLSAFNAKYLLDCESIWKAPNYIEEIAKCIKTIPVKGEVMEVLKKYIEASESGKRKTKKGKIIEPNTIEKYKKAERLLERFAKESGYVLSWKNFNYSFYEKFTRWMWDELNYYDNSVGTVISVLIGFLNWSAKQRFIQDKIYDETWIVWKEEEVDTLVLNPNEIPILYNMPLEDEDQQIRDSFIFDCITLLRCGNLLNLYESDLRITGDSWSISPIQIKVGGQLWIKLPPIGIEIIKRYRGKFETLLPTIHKGAYARGLKRLAKKFREYLNENESLSEGKILNDWNKPFTRIRYKQGKAYKIEVDITDILNPHCARSTGTTSLLIAGMKEFEVKKIGGWTKDSKAFWKYVKIAQRYMDAQSSQAWENIFGTHLKVI